MKNLIYIALLCLTSIVFSQEQNVVIEKSISTQINFGRLGLDCRGRGICSFNISPNKTQTNAQICYNAGSNITLIIDRILITKEEEFKILGQHLENSKANEGEFKLEDDFMFTNQIKTELKIPEQISKIAKGNYRVLISKNTFTIIFKLE